MAVTINSAGTYKVDRVTDAESLTGWGIVKIEGAGGTPSAFLSVGSIDLVAEGSDAVASIANKQRVLLYFTDAAGYDFTSGGAGGGATKVPSGIAYMWAAFLAAGSALLKANGGMQLALSDGTNTSYWNIAGSDTYSGGFIKWAVLTTVTPDENSGTIADLGDITEIGFVADVGAATTRFDNMVVDAIDVGLGLTLQGTTVSDKMFLEAQAQDDATKIGVLEVSNGIIFSQGSVEFSGTNMVSTAEAFVFTDKLGGAYTYQCDMTGTVVMTNSTINIDGVVDYNFDTSGATAFTMNGGSLTGFNTLITAAGQTMNGIVFQSGGLSTIANTISNSPFNQCGQITVTGILDSCTIDKSPDAISTTVTNLNQVAGSIFTSDGSNHAVELTSIGGGSMTWSSTESAYVAGASASPVTPTSTGNETIYVNVATGTLTINVADGASVPSIRSAGAIVNVVAGLKSFSFSVVPSIIGYEWRLYEDSGISGELGTVELATGEESATSDTQTDAYTYSYSTDVNIVLQIIADGYEEFNGYYILKNADQTQTVNLEAESNL